MPVRVSSSAATRARVRITVRGAVQGVGFRPFVYRCAQQLRLSGWVMNSGEGVTLEAEGAPERVAALIKAIHAGPVNAEVSTLETQSLAPRGESVFAIRASAVEGEKTVAVLPDLATCDECLRELLDPDDRRYLYPFTNCTNCGPRHSIIERLPYDRVHTSMRHFAMCDACKTEYEDAGNRRFHAEPNACPACGPRLALWDRSGTVQAREHAALRAAADALRAGLIVAVKGLGGFHLMVDAADERAVRRLRARKHREEKPLALLFPSAADVADCCQVSELELKLLTSPQRPIVLLRRLRRSRRRITDSVAPFNPCLGAMLPYTPLHHLLMRELGAPLVATSGNLSDEPIVTDEAEAPVRLAGIADVFLVHDRPIVRPVDDSVARIVGGREMLLRRARGYAPAHIAADDLPAGILGLGGHLKTTVALSTGTGVVLSQHIGDLDTVEAREAYAAAAADIRRLHAVQPRLVAHDLHPDYHSTHVAQKSGVPVVAVQHHLAHVAACMAEHGLRAPVLGVAWDGTGYGADGTLWGGEFLVLANKDVERVACLRRFRLPGAEAAVREPRRAALGLLYEAFGRDALAMTDLAPVSAFSAAERRTLGAVLERGINAPLTSSAGRLFDAVAALTGLRQRASYEGQAAAELEWSVNEAVGGHRYDFAVRAADDGRTRWILDWEPALRALLTDVRTGTSPGMVSQAFHDALARAIVDIARRIGERRVVLTGGCFQNVYLTEATIEALRQGGFTPYWHRRVPPNDGGIALGQIAWAARLLDRGETTCV